MAFLLAKFIKERDIPAAAPPRYNDVELGPLLDDLLQDALVPSLRETDQPRPDVHGFKG
jgi:hypothetical protein